MDGVALEKRFDGLRRDKCRATKLDLLELAVAKEFVDCSFAQAQSLRDFVNLVSHALQFSFSLSGTLQRLMSGRAQVRFSM